MDSSLRKKLSASKTIQKKARSSNVSAPAAADALEEDLKKAEGVIDSPKTTDASAGVSEDVKEKNNPVSEVQGDAEGGKAESYAEEYDVRHPTGDKMRDKVRDLLSKALEINAEDKSDCLTVAAAIENAMFKKFNGNGPPYKNKYRSISFNLKDAKNQKLRDSVLKRELPPSRLIEMSNQELANDELKKTREKVHERMTRDAMPYNKPAASTDMFKCGKCKERKCTYYQMQTRSADEPLTTFVSCVNCGNRWRF